MNWALLRSTTEKSILRFGTLVSAAVFYCGIATTGFGCAAHSDTGEEPSGAADTLNAYDYYSDLGSEFSGEGCAEIGLRTEELGDSEVVARAKRQFARAAAIAFTDFAQYRRSIFALASLHGVQLQNIGAPCAVNGNPGVQFTFRLTGPTDLLPNLLREDDLEAEAVDAEHVRVAYAMAGYEQLLSTRDGASEPYNYGQTVALTVSHVDPSPDAYPPFADFISDDRLDVGLFMGSADPSPTVGLDVAYELEGEGFRWRTPAARPTLDNLPAEIKLSRTARALGRNIELQVTILFAQKLGGETEVRTQVPLLYRNNDIVVYDGHGAIERGLDAGHNVYFNATDFASFGLSPARKQFFAFLGCRTYSVFGEGLFALAAKDRDALDVLVTTNLNPWESPSSERFILAMVKTYNSQLTPPSFYSLVRWLNSHPAAREEQTIYGVAGIEDNSAIHPFARVDRLGMSCNGGCGDAIGNECVGDRCAVRVLRNEVCTTVLENARGLWCRGR